VLDAGDESAPFLAWTIHARPVRRIVATMAIYWTKPGRLGWLRGGGGWSRVVAAVAAVVRERARARARVRMRAEAGRLFVAARVGGEWWI
jgi:hypothetical protein